MKTLRWSLDGKNRPVKDANGQFWGRRKAEAEAFRRKRVAYWQRWSISPMDKDQATDWRKGDVYFDSDVLGHITRIIRESPNFWSRKCLLFWNKRSAELFIEKAKRKGIPLEEAIKQARIEYGWDDATVKNELTVQQEEPVKNKSLKEIIDEFRKSNDPITREQIDIVRKHPEFNKLPYRPFYTFYDSDGDQIYSEGPKQMFISRTWIAPSVINIERGQAYWTAEAAIAALDKQEEPVKWIERENGDIPVWGDHATVVSAEKLSVFDETERDSAITGWIIPTPINEKHLEYGPFWGQKTGEYREYLGTLRIRYLNPAWVEWNRKSDEQVESTKTTTPEPEQPEKQSVTALLRSEIEKRNLRIDKMRKALNEAMHEVQAIELTILLLEEEE